MPVKTLDPKITYATGVKFVRKLLSMKKTGEEFSSENVVYIRACLTKTSVSKIKEALEYLETKSGDNYSILTILLEESLEIKFGECFKYVTECLATEKDFCVLTKLFQNISDVEFKLDVLEASIRTLGINLQDLKSTAKATAHPYFYKLLSCIKESDTNTNNLSKVDNDVQECYCSLIINKTVKEIADFANSVMGRLDPIPEEPCLVGESGGF